MFPSDRSHVDPFRVMQILVEARSRDDALLLCVGQPSTGAPRAVIERVHSRIDASALGYTATLGIPELREAIAQWHAQTYGIDTAARNVVVTTGSSGGFVALFLAALDHGDPIAMTRPGYPAYRNALTALGAKIIDLPCGAETRFQPTVEMLEACVEKPKALIVTSPDNPSGTIIDGAELARITDWCERNSCLLISDEIYHGITYGRECHSAREYSDKAVVVGSLSKYFSMTGWRLGWLIVPDELVEALDNLQANLALCPPAVSQEAALAAFGPEARAELESHVQRYARNRALLLKRLPELGLDKSAPPDGGFYLYIDVSEHTDDSEVWVRELLNATGVALAPGVDFDPVDGHRFVRLSFCGEYEEILQACERLRTFMP
ncbi:aspartate aminotransferase [Corynebacterium diphtheriae]|nr:aspartate aminotransferase [Corynebacterium diphtheriae]